MSPPDSAPPAGCLGGNFPKFSARYRTGAFTAALASRMRATPDAVETLIDGNLRQAEVALDMLSALDLRGKRVLEVGAGQGFVSLYLRSLGIDATALEPATSGFAYHRAVNEEVRAATPEVALPFLDIPVEQLDPSRHGRFDVVFSVYVLEHLTRLDESFAAMVSVLAPDGVMMHLAANYAFPYEPHFGVFLVPGLPKAAELWLPERITKGELWTSLNFVTCGRVKRLCRRHALRPSFARGLLYRQLRRFEQEAAFRARHDRPVIAVVLRVLHAVGLLGLTRYLPAGLVSPMQFTAHFKAEN